MRLIIDVNSHILQNKILNLQNPLEKMNKSDNGDNKGTIFLMDEVEVVKKKIMCAKTDNFNNIHFDEENQPGISNLISILSKITDEGVEFRSHLSGEKLFISPEKAIEIENALGADIIMAFDVCSEYGITYKKAEENMYTTLNWLKRCYDAQKNENQMRLRKRN